MLLTIVSIKIKNAKRYIFKRRRYTTGVIMSYKERVEQDKKHYAKMAEKLEKHNPETATGNSKEREKSYQNLKEYIFIKVKKHKSQKR